MTVSAGARAPKGPWPGRVYVVRAHGRGDLGDRGGRRRARRRGGPPAIFVGARTRRPGVAALPAGRGRSSSGPGGTRRARSDRSLGRDGLARILPAEDPCPCSSAPPGPPRRWRDSRPIELAPDAVNPELDEDAWYERGLPRGRRSAAHLPRGGDGGGAGLLPRASPTSTWGSKIGWHLGVRPHRLHLSRSPCGRGSTRWAFWRARPAMTILGELTAWPRPRRRRGTPPAARWSPPSRRSSCSREGSRLSNPDVARGSPGRCWRPGSSSSRSWGPPWPSP